MTNGEIVDAILEAISAAQTPESVEEVADTYREDVKRLYGLPEWRVRAIHIVNYKSYRLWELKNGKTVS